MASRENQTMQIFLIVLALTSLILIVSLVMVNSARTKALASADSANAKASTANNDLRQAQSESVSYKEMLGYAAADNLDTLRENFDEDMKKWGATLGEDERSFRLVVDSLFREKETLAQRESDVKNQLKQLNMDLLATQQQTNDQIKKYTEDTQKVQADKAALQSEFTKAREKSKQAQNKMAEQLAEQNERIDRINTEHEAAQQELQTKIKKMERVIAILENKIVPEDPYAQPADGRIAWVNQREGKVWINLGEADHLRPQVTFSVYSGDANDVNAAETKGSIEIVRLLSDHMAEARITTDKATRPLMEGDKVYSQVWSRGRQIGFAITGLVDLNNDGSDDLQQLKQIIQINNGKVDAAPDGEGDVEGQMTVNTRYLILGEHTEDNRPTSEASRSSYQKMSAEAATLHIEVITLSEFLSLMGWVSEHRAIKMGKDARSEDFPARHQTNLEPRKSSGNKSIFRKRIPAVGY